MQRFGILDGPRRFVEVNFWRRLIDEHAFVLGSKMKHLLPFDYLLNVMLNRADQRKDKR
jgi:hypothetical protein